MREMYMRPKSMSSCRAASHACALSAYAQCTDSLASSSSSESASCAVLRQHARQAILDIMSRRRDVMTMGCSGGSPPTVPLTSSEFRRKENFARREKSMPATTTNNTLERSPKNDIGYSTQLSAHVPADRVERPVRRHSGETRLPSAALSQMADHSQSMPLDT